MKKNLGMTKTRYSEHILLIPWPFVVLRFHYILLLLGLKKIVCYTATISCFTITGGKENRSLHREDFVI